jgi:glutamate 5-kinase
MSDQAWAKNARRALGGCRRVVVKIGSKTLATEDAPFRRIAKSIAKIMNSGAGGRSRRRVVLVSSGAIALGMQHLGMKGRPRKMAGLLMQRWGNAFSKHRLAVAQVLLSHADLANRVRANNARDAVTQLLDLGVVPIINENDAVAVDEIRFGDNDALAAMVTPLCDGDLLVLLSDVEGLLAPDGTRVSALPSVDDEAFAMVRSGASPVGTGGMRSKLEAARRATLAGAHVVIAGAQQPRVLERVLAGDDVGTLVVAVARALSNRKHWIAYTLRPLGAAIVDGGAADAIRRRNTSVLCVGVLGVRGRFAPGDAISIVAPDGEEIARGLSRLSSSDAARLAGEKNGAASTMLVHRDDLVLLGP